MKKIICMLLTLSMLFSLAAVEVGARQYTYEQMADFLNDLDILHGDASKGGDYDFYSYLTRAQFSKLAVAASVYKNSVPIKTNTSPYSDVTREHWAAGYVKVASQNKLVSGYPDSTFRPENNVLLEEGVTIILKLLGYENSDFGGEWPNGQMGIAKNTGLLDNVNAVQGSAMTRLDAIALIFNALNGDTKQGNTYLNSLGYTKSEDVTLISSYIQDSTLDTDEITTSEGTYRILDDFDYNHIGMRGDILLKNNKKIVGFYPDGQEKETFVVIGVLGNDVVVNVNGVNKTFDISDDTVVYYNSTKTTYSNLVNRVSAGDSFSIIKDSTGRIKYATVETQSMDGPIRVTSTSFLSGLSMNEAETTIIKAGGVVSAEDVNINDIIYYSKNLNTVWVYQDKRVGIYEEAIPNQEFPKSIVLSGTTYEIESAAALSKLSSTGDCKLGQSITILLGKDGKIADIATGGVNSEAVYGYAVGIGSKQYTVNAESYTSYYISVVTPDGSEYEYVTDRLYENIRCKPVKLTFTNSVAKVTALEGGGVSGRFNLSNLTLGTNKIVKNVNIIDVKDNDITENGEYKKIYPARIDGVEIEASDVLYYEKNSSGEIISLILKDVTGDCYDYGVVLKAEEKGGTSYIHDGKESSTGTFFTVKSKTPVKLDLKNNQLKGVTVLNAVSGIKSFNESYITDTNGKKHYLSDKVSVYYVNSEYDYMLMPLSDVIKNQENYRITAYYDKNYENGGRIRIIIIR